MSAESDFFHQRGLPYQASNMGALYGSIISKGNQKVVIAQVGDPLGKMRYYLGYYGEDETREVERRIRRVRKYPVYTVGVV